MDKPERAPNIVPRGAIRLSEAFAALCRRLEPEWQDLQQRCVQWDELLDNDIDERGEDPYPQLVAATYDAEMAFRTTLRDAIRAYVHNLRTGIDLDQRTNGKSRRSSRIQSDYTHQRTPGPDCRLDGTTPPRPLPDESGIRQLARCVEKRRHIDFHRGQRKWGRFSIQQVTRAFSWRRYECTGLSKTKLYERRPRKRTCSRKSGVRTLILDNDISTNSSDGYRASRSEALQGTAKKNCS